MHILEIYKYINILNSKHGNISRLELNILHIENVEKKQMM